MTVSSEARGSQVSHLTVAQEGGGGAVAREVDSSLCCLT